MFLRFMLRLLGLHTATEPAEGATPGEAPPAAAAADAGAPGAPGAPSTGAGPDAGAGGQSLEEMDAAAAARANAIASGTPVEEVAPDDMPYRDAATLRQELAKARETYGPIIDGLPASHRDAYIATMGAEALVLANPAAAVDLATMRAAYPSLAPEEQEVVRSIVANATADPAGTLENIAQAGAILRGEAGDGDGSEGDGLDEWGFEPDDPNRPITMADAERMFTERQDAAVHERETQAQYEGILTELKDRGYDPTSLEPLERGLATAVIDIAAQLPDGGLAGAMDLMDMMAQRYIDDYVAGKRQDASRPQPTPGGAPPAAAGSEPTTWEQMDAAADERARAAAARG